jgi:hypothetical protein
MASRTVTSGDSIATTYSRVLSSTIRKLAAPRAPVLDHGLLGPAEDGVPLVLGEGLELTAHEPDGGRARVEVDVEAARRRGDLPRDRGRDPHGPRGAQRESVERVAGGEQVDLDRPVHPRGAALDVQAGDVVHPVRFRGGGERHPPVAQDREDDVGAGVGVDDRRFVGSGGCGLQGGEEACASAPAVADAACGSEREERKGEGEERGRAEDGASH